MKYEVIFECLLCKKLYWEYTVTSEKSISFEFTIALDTTAKRFHSCIRSENELSGIETTVAGVAVFAGIMTEEEWIKSQQILEDAVMKSFGRSLVS